MNRGPSSVIDLSALERNLAVVRKIVNKKTVIAIVKADAYGHGSVEISRRLVSLGVDRLAVAFTGEAKLLREAGIRAGIIVLFDRASIEDYFTYSLIPVIQDRESALAFSREASRRGTKVRVHVKVDTGMGRVGFAPETAVDEIAGIAGMEGIELEGLMSHFSEADLGDRSFAVSQLDVFSVIRDAVSARIGRRPLCHIANSAAVLSFPDAVLDAARPGLLLYGCSPFNEDYGLTPLMNVRTNLLAVRRLRTGTPVSYGRTFVTRRESEIAVVPAGYADGYNRLFSNNAEMLVRGRRAPVVGRVCMDLTMLDVTGIGGVREGDEVVLLGRQGDETITAAELAGRINTIPYEIVTSLGSRARREYVN
ncbi:MAG: alanine racemase [Nitrospiraceae bacterium]|nr:alanine racemase [Nitrospiraceae bacterium]